MVGADYIDGQYVYYEYYSDSQGYYESECILHNSASIFASEPAIVLEKPSYEMAPGEANYPTGLTNADQRPLQQPSGYG